MGEESDIKKMKVQDLRAALEKRGLSTDGLKADLVNRLQARLDEEEFGIIAPPSSSATAEDEKEEKAADDDNDAVAAEAAPEPPKAQKEEKAEEKPKEAEQAPAKADSTAAKTNVVMSQQETQQLSFAEKMKKRAERFGTSSNKDKRQRNNTARSTETATKKQKQNSSQWNKNSQGEKPMLSKEEIEKRLARAKKYGIQGPKTDELKNMLRKYRFSGAAGN